MLQKKRYSPYFDGMLEVGFRHGGAIRQWREQERGPESTGAGVPRAPHYRVAHWHLYWTGKGRVTPKIRFMLPVAVNMKGVEEPPVHLRAVLAAQ